MPPPPPGENDDQQAAVGPADGTDDAGPDSGAPPPSGDDAGASDGRDEVAEPPHTELVSIDGRTYLMPSAPDSPDTRPLWLAVLLGIAAGIGLTLTASVVVSNLEHPED